MAKNVDVTAEDILAGLSAVISINVNEPNFSSQAKVKLSGKEVGDAIYNSLVKELTRFVNGMSEQQQQDLTTKIVNNAKIRQAAEVAKATRKKSIAVKSNPANLPSNLKDCAMAGSDEAELYITEGLSAAGTIVAARNANFQGVLPIRGKILNVMKLDLTKKKQRDRFLANAEINDMIKALGAGSGDQFDIDKARYGKVVFACFTGDTIVATADGRITFKELVDSGVKELQVYSRDGRDVVLARAINPRVVAKDAPLMEVQIGFDRIRCTPDHNFLMIDGKMKRADELVVGDLISSSDYCDAENGELRGAVVYGTKNLPEKEDVYCLTVPEYGNFAICSDGARVYNLSAGEYGMWKQKEDHGRLVFVKNCDSDTDGLAINCLLLGVFYKLFRPMIEEGRVYQCVSPFYEIDYKVKGKEVFEYAMNERERVEIEERLQAKKVRYNISLNKGLGELNADTFHNVVLNPNNRTLIRITMNDAEAANEMLEKAIGMGSADDRKEWMLNHTDVIDELGLYT